MNKPKDTIKIVINDCYGGFSLSKEALNLLDDKLAMQGLWLKDKDGIFLDNFSFGIRKNARTSYLYRSAPALVEVIEELGSEKASHPASWLVVIEIPVDSADYWDIFDYDGKECVYDTRYMWEGSSEYTYRR